MTQDRVSGAALQVEKTGIWLSGVRVLDDVSFDVTPGEVHALIGPNGAGKSTLFNILSGICKPTSGHVRLDGRDIAGLKPPKVARLGVGRAFQNSSMFSGLSVEDNILLGLHRGTRAGFFQCGLRLPGARREERQARSEVRRIARLLDVESLLGEQAGDLPYGDAKRVDVARALCAQPGLLLLDEPAAGLHTHEKRFMQHTIADIAGELGTTIVLVEHDMNLVMQVADRITVLDSGRVLTSGVPAEIRRHPGVIEAYLGHARAETEPDISAAQDLMAEASSEATVVDEQSAMPREDD